MAWWCLKWCPSPRSLAHELIRPVWTWPRATRPRAWATRSWRRRCAPLVTEKGANEKHAAAPTSNDEFEGALDEAAAVELVAMLEDAGDTTSESPQRG